MNLSRSFLEVLLRNLSPTFYLYHFTTSTTNQRHLLPLQGTFSKKDAEEMKEKLMDDAEKESAWFSKCGYQEDYGSN